MKTFVDKSFMLAFCISVMGLCCIGIKFLWGKLAPEFLWVWDNHDYLTVGDIIGSLECSVLYAAGIINMLAICILCIYVSYITIRGGDLTKIFSLDKKIQEKVSDR